MLVNDPVKVISVKDSKGNVLLEVKEVIERVITLWYYLRNWYDSSYCFIFNKKQSYSNIILFMLFFKQKKSLENNYESTKNEISNNSHM